MIDPSTGEHRESTSEMAASAVRQALERAGLAPEQVDLLVLTTATPEYTLPPTVNLVQEKLGLQRCATLDLRSGGAGIVQGLDIARLYLEHGVYRTAAVVASEAISPYQAPLFLGKDPEKVRVRDRLLVYMFGDGAAAIVLQAGEGDDGILGSAMACIGGCKQPGMRVVGGGTHAPFAAQQAAARLMEIRIDFAEATTFTPVLMAHGIQDTLRQLDVAPNRIALVITPEGDAEWMVSGREDGHAPPSELAGLESRIYNVLPQMGAPGSAALPLALDHAWKSGRIGPGDQLLLLAMETTKWIYAGMLVTWTAPPIGG
jgi:3-oxoacyl-[acyl-carrier-protein] synthase-3